MVIRRTRGLARRLWRGALRLALALALAAVALVLLFRWINPPPGIHMLSERLRLGGIERDWDRDRLARREGWTVDHFLWKHVVRRQKYVAEVMLEVLGLESPR